MHIPIGKRMKKCIIVPLLASIVITAGCGKSKQEPKMLLTPPNITIESIPIDMHWTLQDFLNSPLAGQMTEFSKLTWTIEDDGNTLKQNAYPTSIEELLENPIGSTVQCKKVESNVTLIALSFTYQKDSTIDELADVTVLDLPIAKVRVSGASFDCNEITQDMGGGPIKTIFGETTAIINQNTKMETYPYKIEEMGQLIFQVSKNYPTTLQWDRNQ